MQIKVPWYITSVYIHYDIANALNLKIDSDSGRFKRVFERRLVEVPCILIRTLRSGDGDKNHLISSPFLFRLCEEVLYEMNATGTYRIGLNLCICQINNASNQKEQNQLGDSHGIEHQEGIVDDAEFVSVRSERIQESPFDLL